MDAVKYFKEKSRLCKNNATCTECPLFQSNSGKDLACGDLEADYPEQAVAIIIKWSAEHPVKTRQSEFLKMFPNAGLDIEGILRIDPCDLDIEMEKRKVCNAQDCDACRKNYWLAEVE